MLVIPSIDIRGGRCVRLVGGKAEAEKVYGDPVEFAQRWVAEGASYLHLIDLDAAMGMGDNFARVAEVLTSVRVGVQVGGGIRTPERAFELLGIGASRVILGTAAIKSQELVGELVERAGADRVMVALDSRSGKVAIEGWRKQTDEPTLELARKFERLGVGSLLFTNIDLDGSMRGVAVREIKELVDAVEIPVFASGGVGSLEDLRAVREAGAEGVVIGRALYEGRFTLKRALEVVR